LEAAREIAGTLAQSQNKVMLDSQSLLLNGTYSRDYLNTTAVMSYFTVAGDDAKSLLHLKK
jgi:hypothetical protein